MLISIDLKNNKIIAKLNYNSNIRCAIRKGKTVFIPVRSLNECQVMEYSLSSNSISIHRFNISEVTECSIDYCFMDGRKNYAFFSVTKSEGVIQVDISRKFKFISYISGMIYLIIDLYVLMLFHSWC
jgi:hypothetical protein